VSLLEPNRDLRTIVTRRSLLPPLSDRGHPRWRAAWEHLFRTYHAAMLRYAEMLLQRLPGGDPQEAGDVVQAYLADVLDGGQLANDQEHIRCFRAWLQVQLRRFTISWVRRRTAAKRGGALPGVADALDQVADTRHPEVEDTLSRAWVEVALERALARLRRGNETYAAVIEDLRRHDGEASADLADRLSLTAVQLANAKHRARRRLSSLFAEELRSTVRDDESFDELWRTLEPFLP
jgi:DNA-directed RNA polymerase specialized sigma24 family protein